MKRLVGKRLVAAAIGTLTCSFLVYAILPRTGLLPAQEPTDPLPLFLGSVGGAAGWWAGLFVLNLLDML